MRSVLGPYTLKVLSFFFIGLHAHRVVIPWANNKLARCVQPVNIVLRHRQDQSIVKQDIFPWVKKRIVLNVKLATNAPTPQVCVISSDIFKIC